MLISLSSSKSIEILATDFEARSENISSYTLTMDIGVADPNRVVAILLGAGEGVGREATSVTVNGYSLTKRTSDGNTNGWVHIWSGVVPVGSGVQNVVVNLGNSTNRFLAVSVAMLNTSATPESANSIDVSGTTSISATLPSVSKDSLVLAFGFQRIASSTAGTFSNWVGATTEFVEELAGDSRVRGAAAYSVANTSSSSYSVSVTSSISANLYLTTASFPLSS
jgi:hypothetical protein